MDEVFFLKRLRFNAKLQLPPLYVSVLKFADQKKKNQNFNWHQLFESSEKSCWDSFKDLSRGV